MLDVKYSTKNDVVIIDMQTDKCPSWCVPLVTNILIYSKHYTILDVIPRREKCAKCRKRLAPIIVDDFAITDVLCSVCCLYMDDTTIRKISYTTYFGSTYDGNLEYSVIVDYEKHLICIQTCELLEEFLYYSALRYIDLPTYSNLESSARLFATKIMGQYMLILRELIHNNVVVYVIIKMLQRAVIWY